MNTTLLKTLVKTALVTSPIMAIIFITPVFVMSGLDISILWMPMLMGVWLIMVAWTINIVILIKVNKPWAKRWHRMLLSSFIMICIGYVILLFITPPINLSREKIEILRIVNIVAINTIIFILVDLIISRENEVQLAKENSELKFTYLEAKYQLLKNQINPHFLFNSLSTAKSLVKRDPAMAEEFLIRLSGLLRASINNDNKTNVLKEEIGFCNDYISLQKLRFGNAIKYEYNIKDSDLTKSVPYFSLITLLENAIKHNSLTEEEPLYISIESDSEYIEVRNNIQSKFILEESTKTGLKNLNERYQLLTQSELMVNNTGTMFTVRFKLI